MADQASRRAKFSQVYKRIADELVNELGQLGIPDDAMNWYRKVQQISWYSNYADISARVWIITSRVVN